jgi:flagellar basal body rod protein FlgG
MRVRDHSGAVFLTRAGHLNTDATGRLVTPEGWSVEGQGGPIVIPPDARRVTIGEDGRITVETGEGANASPQVLEQMRLVTVPEPMRMRAENGVYFDPGDQLQSDAGDAALRQGFLEKANVDPLQELAQMIAVQRRYDAAQRALREQSGAGSSLNSLLSNS